MTTDFVSSVALGCIAAYGLVAFGWRTLVQVRRTGSTGWRGLHGTVGSAPWWAGVLVVVGLVGLLVAPILQWRGPIAEVSTARMMLAALTFALGFALTVVAQISMADAWRIGVRRGERTDLHTSGPFAWCRNPIFTGMLLTAFAVALVVPWAGLAAAALWLGLQLQVRVVEEPHLVELHGAAYRAYAASTGRFVPWLGRGGATEG